LFVIARSMNFWKFVWSRDVNWCQLVGSTIECHWGENDPGNVLISTIQFYSLEFISILKGVGLSF
jgi:hypothetical protein